ncbi:MAG: metallophosphoesterase family protein [Acidimicrobiales bacterium]
MRFIPAPRSPAVFGVGTTDAQIVWTRPARDVRVTSGGHSADADVHASIDAGGRPGALVVDGLSAAATVALSIEVDGATVERRLTTLPHPGGAELSRFATMNDLHLGLHTFGLTHRIAEPGDTDCTSMRCATAAFVEAVDWGAQALFLKGDIVHLGRAVEWEMLGELLTWSPVPVHATFGNHEAAHRRHDRSREQFELLGASNEAIEVIELPGLRVVLVDTSTPDSHAGRIAHVHDDLVSLAGDGVPMLVLHHHQLHATPWPPIYPKGILGSPVRALTAAIAERNPNVVFASGHTHRHRRRYLGGLTLAELGSSKDYPGTWCGYVVHEGGLTQTVRRIAAPAALEWTERTGRALGGWWSHWSPGRIEDRCFTVTWR